jgi:hypothetical protein
LGAIKKVRGPGMTPAEDQAQQALRRVIWPNGHQYGETLASWNDHPNRDVDDVRSIVIQAAEKLESSL